MLLKLFQEYQVIRRVVISTLLTWNIQFSQENAENDREIFLHDSYIPDREDDLYKKD